MNILSTLTFFTTLSISSLAHCQTSGEWCMPQTERTQWLHTLQSLAPASDWTVANEGNNFIIEHNTPAPFYKPALINAYPGSPQARAKYRFDQELRITLRFSPLLNDKEWLKRENENLVAQEANEQLMKKFQIGRAFGMFVISGHEMPVRLRQYQNEAQKLISHHLPQLHSEDRSVLVSRSWTNGGIDLDTPVGSECAQVLENIHAQFKPHQKRMSYIKDAPVDGNSSRTDIFWLNLDEETANHPLYPVKVSVWKKATSTP